MSDTKLAELPDWATGLLDTARVGHLGFLDDEDHPRVLPVTFAVCRGVIWSAIDGKPKRTATPARLRYLERSSRATLTVDHYSDEWSELAWVQVIGQVRIVPAPEDPGGVIAALSDKYAQYRASPPPGPLLELAPARVLWWQAA